MQPQRVGRNGDEHGTHTKVQPASGVQHIDAGVHHRPACASFFQDLKVCGIERVLAQVVIAAVHVVPLDPGLTLQLLNEMTVPVQAADECP